MMTTKDLHDAMAPLNDREARLRADHTAVTQEIAALRTERTRSLAAGAERGATAPITSRITQLEDEAAALAEALQAVTAELAPFIAQIMPAAAADAEARYRETVDAGAPARAALLAAAVHFVNDELPPLRAAFATAQHSVVQAASVADRARAAAGLPTEFHGTLPLFTGDFDLLSARRVLEFLDAAEVAAVALRASPHAAAPAAA